MTLSETRLARTPGRRLALIAAAAIAPALAACNATAPAVAVSPASLSATPAPSSTHAPAPAQQLVVAARTNYTMAIGEAERSRNVTEARELLRPYLEADRIDALVETMSSIWARGEVFYGQDVLHILRVTVTGAVAFVYDCDDTSSMGLKYASTGQPVPGSAGTVDMNLITRLELVRGHWLVKFQVVVDKPCTA